MLCAKSKLSLDYILLFMSRNWMNKKQEFVTPTNLQINHWRRRQLRHVKMSLQTQDGCSERWEDVIRVIRMGILIRWSQDKHGPPAPGVQWLSAGLSLLQRESAGPWEAAGTDIRQHQGINTKYSHHTKRLRELNHISCTSTSFCFAFAHQALLVLRSPKICSQ